MTSKSTDITTCYRQATIKEHKKVDRVSILGHIMSFFLAVPKQKTTEEDIHTLSMKDMYRELHAIEKSKELQLLSTHSRPVM